LAWAENPSDMIEKAQEKARDVFAAAENQCPLAESQRAEIRGLMKEADAAVGDRWTPTTG